MFNTPPKPSSASSVLALSPLRSSSLDRNQQLLYGNRSPDGSNAAVVLYDPEQQMVIARRLPSPSPNVRGEASASQRCPLCNSDLSDLGATATAENYFETLSYFHKHLPLLAPGADEPTRFAARSPSEATRDLHDLSAKLLVNGYYSRFFEEVCLVGTGSFGSVFLCRHVIDSVQLGEFAVKKVPVGDSREWLRGIMKEVKALERLATHPNIVSYKHSWLEMNRANELCPFVPYLFILMSYCDGGSLETFSMASPLTSDDVIWSLFLDICHGLQHLHRNFVIHRDLKLSNILLMREPRLKAVLSDFGTAEIVSSNGRSTSTNGSNATGFTGTAEYTAPEVFQSHTYSEASDMYSLGIVLFAICYGKVPFSHPDPSICARIIIENPIIEIPLEPQRDPDLRSMISALTARDPASRPSCDDILFHPFIRQKLERSVA